MLNFLKVKNLAIVENAEVSFSQGLNIITGETGSGKSVIIGALNLILGERADHGSIRTGEKELSVEASFSLKNTFEIDAFLSEAGLPGCEEGQLLIRRTVSLSGSGKCWINDSSSTVATLRRLGEKLIDMHGPYDHQSLLSSDFQLKLLDAFGKTDVEKAKYKEKYDSFHSLLSEKEELLSESGENIDEEIDRLSYITNEIESAALTNEDETTLVERHKEACNANAILENGSQIINELTEGENSLFDELAHIQQSLIELSRIIPEGVEWHDEVASCAITIQELSKTMRERLLKIDSDPEALANLEARMELVQKLKRKYGTTIEAINEKYDKAKTKLDRLLLRGKRLLSLDGEIAKAKAQLIWEGEVLTAQRKEAAKILEKEITQELKPLGFNQSYFAVDVRPHEPSPTGLDEIVFSFAPNIGEFPMPLKSIASSGEIARVMLATKSVLAEHDSIPLLVFDEIDSNIGGEVGKAVGAKLKKLSSSHQVISITHLPQVAAFGEDHFAVSKHVEENRTLAKIQKLDSDGRVRELSRMLGGSDITSVVLAHAKELLKIGNNG